MKMSLVFDLDGTLVESAPDIHNAANKVLLELGYAPLSLETVISFIGNGVPKLVERVMDKVGIAHSERYHEELVNKFTSYYAANPARLSYLNKGALKALEQLHSDGYKMAICTNKPYQLTMRVLRGLNIDNYFEVVIGGDSLKVKKPDPAPLNQAMQLLGETACIYIGDSEVDAQTAVNAGQPFFLFTDGYRKARVEDLNPVAVFDDFATLHMILHRS